MTRRFWSIAKPRLLRVWRCMPSRLQGYIEWALLPKFLVGSTAVVLDETERVLLFRHTYRTIYPWGLPGGWLKVGEAPEEAVVREVFEESGYRIRALHPLIIGGDRGLRRLDLMFLCDLVGGEFRPSAEVSGARFFTADELPGRVEPFHVQVAAYAARVVRGEVTGQPVGALPSRQKKVQ